MSFSSQDNDNSDYVHKSMTEMDDDEEIEQQVQEQIPVRQNQTKPERDTDDDQDQDEEDDDAQKDLDPDQDFQELPVGSFLESLDKDNVDAFLQRELRGFTADLKVAQLRRYLPILKRIEPIIKKFGLFASLFNSFFEALMHQKLRRIETEILIDCLLPRTLISEEYIVQIIGKIHLKDTDLAQTADMLNWAVSIYDVIRSKDKIRKLYSVLFHSLYHDSMRAPACHLMYFLTKREHVIPYRVKRLKALIETEKDNAQLIGLLMVYQTFDFSISVPHNVRLTNTFVFTTPHPNMKTQMTKIRKLWKNIKDYTDDRRGEFQLPTKKKARRLNTIDKLDDSGELSSELDVIDITRIANGVDNLDVAEQFAVVLENRKLQHLLLIKRNDVVIERLTYWIAQRVLDLSYKDNAFDPMKSELHEMLKILVTFTRFTKSQLPVIESFLFQYLKTWNGFEFEDEIFELITYIKPTNYKDFYEAVLMRLYRLFIVSSAKWKAKLIICYTNLLNNWALLDWNRHTQLGKLGGSDIDHITTAFGVLSFDINYFTTIQRLIEHIDRMCVMGLLAENDDPLLQHVGLSFFELVATISVQDDIPDIIIPAATFVHRNFYSSSAMAVSRVCGMLHQYKIAFEENDNKTEDWMSKHTAAYVSHFNTYLMDVCNILWKNNGLGKVNEDGNVFSLTTQNILEFQRICSERDMDVKKILAITHAPSFAGFSKRFMTMLEKQEESEVAHNEPVTTISLSQLEENGGVSISYPEFRTEFLNHLHGLGFQGVRDLLYACMASLKRLK